MGATQNYTWTSESRANVETSDPVSEVSIIPTTKPAINVSKERQKEVA
ncbi:MAG: hypothetical protein M0019_11205 [Actinomycetota bacterium]|nr:hypothetical protein [Actinomycetota bacterium]